MPVKMMQSKQYLIFYNVMKLQHKKYLGKGQADIILVSPEFSRELIITVNSQISKGDNIRCIRIEPYKLNNNEIIVDFDEVNIAYEMSVINAHDRDLDLFGYFKGL